MNAKRRAVVIERTYRASVEDLWALWTTKEGFESWWGPDGCRVDVHAIEARPGGRLHYDMVAMGAAQIADVKQLGHEIAQPVRARFSEMERHRRLVLTHIMDFVGGVAPYESTIVAEFSAAGESVRMTVTIAPMHDEEYTHRAVTAFINQLRKLEGRFLEGRFAPGG